MSPGLPGSLAPAPPKHMNDERDVLLAMLEGSAPVSMDGEQHELRGGDAVVVGKGRRRKIIAERGGVRYLSFHRRRPPLQIDRLEAERKAT
jgi:mannose-6-phosphate isomerase-like protein (cupin superfamily)